MINSKQIDYIQNDCEQVLAGQLGTLTALKNKSLFMSGANGYVGKWLIELINHLNEHHKFNINIKACATSISQSAKDYPHIFKKKYIDLIDKDIKNLSEIDASVSYVLHLAGNPDNRIHSSNPVKIMKDIILGTTRILDACNRLEKLLNFTHFSSGHVYGQQPFEAMNVNENTFYSSTGTRLLSYYGEAKRASESLVNAYRSQYKIPTTILRPFAFIGPYQLIDRPWAINNFIRDGLYGQSIRILGEPTTIRSYMYPSEMALWTLRAVLNPSEENVFNLGSSDSMDLQSIAQIVEQSFGGHLGVSTNSPPGALNKSKFIPDISKFETVFDLPLKIGTEEAIRKAVTWYKLGD